MQVDLGIWNKLTWAVTMLGLIAGSCLIGAAYVPLLKQNERMRAQIATLDAMIRVEETNTDNLRADIDAYLHDPHTVERLARDRLHYAKPSETVIRYVEPGGNPATSN